MSRSNKKSSGNFWSPELKHTSELKILRDFYFSDINRCANNLVHENSCT
jgi:hypothetical protein